MNNLYEKLREAVSAEAQVLQDVPMAEYTTFKAGGPADLMVIAACVDDIHAASELAKEAGVPVFVLGNGSDVLFTDKGFRGLVIHIGKKLGNIVIEGDRVTAEAGAMMSAVANAAAKESLTGLEFASGIPGSIGGGVFMNAGAYGGEMKFVVESVEALTPEGNVICMSGDELDFDYRHSAFMDNGMVILKAVMQLAKGDQEEIYATMKDLAHKRSSKQPLEFPSAGSTFKRPEGHFAGKLIDDAGCRGLSVGQAQVSPKHAGFVVNNGGATAAEILDLIALVQLKVKEDFGVDLHPEVRIIGER